MCSLLRFLCFSFFCRFLYSFYCYLYVFFFFKQKPAYEMRISDWSSDVCSSDLVDLSPIGRGVLRNRTDMGPLARRALASFGPHDLVLTSSAAPEKAEAAAVSQMEPEPEPAAAPGPSGSQIQHLVERIESFQSSRATHPSAIEPREIGRAHV